MQLNAYIDVDAYRSLYLDMLNIFWLCRHATYTLQCASRRCVHAGAHAVQWRSGTGVPHVPLFCYHLKGFLRDLKGVSMYLCSVSSLWMMRVPEKKQTTNPLPFIFQPRQKSLWVISFSYRVGTNSITMNHHVHLKSFNHHFHPLAGDRCARLDWPHPAACPSGHWIFFFLGSLLSDRVIFTLCHLYIYIMKCNVR